MKSEAIRAAARCFDRPFSSKDIQRLCWIRYPRLPTSYITRVLCADFRDGYTMRVRRGWYLML